MYINIKARIIFCTSLQLAITKLIKCAQLYLLVKLLLISHVYMCIYLRIVYSTCRIGYVISEKHLKHDSTQNQNSKQM